MDKNLFDYRGLSWGFQEKIKLKERVLRQTYGNN